MQNFNFDRWFGWWFAPAVMVVAMLGVGAGCSFDDDEPVDDDRQRVYDGGPLPDYDGGQCLWASDIASGDPVTPPARCCELGENVSKPNSCQMCNCNYNLAGAPVWRCTYEADVCNFDDTGDADMPDGTSDSVDGGAG